MSVEVQTSLPQSVSRASTVAMMLRALRAERQETTVALMRAVAVMLSEIDPDGKRDHRSHWDATLTARRTKPDLFERLRWTANELTVLSAEMGCTDDLAALAVLLEREEAPLVRLERDTPAVQLQRRWFPDLHAAELPVAIRALRRQHEAAEHVLRLLGKVAA